MVSSSRVEPNHGLLLQLVDAPPRTHQHPGHERILPIVSAPLTYTERPQPNRSTLGASCAADYRVLPIPNLSEDLVRGLPKLNQIEVNGAKVGSSYVRSSASSRGIGGDAPRADGAETQCRAFPGAPGRESPRRGIPQRSRASAPRRGPIEQTGTDGETTPVGLVPASFVFAIRFVPRLATTRSAPAQIRAPSRAAHHTRVGAHESSATLNTSVGRQIVCGFTVSASTGAGN